MRCLFQHPQKICIRNVTRQLNDKSYRYLTAIDNDYMPRKIPRISQHMHKRAYSKSPKLNTRACQTRKCFILLRAISKKQQENAGARAFPFSSGWSLVLFSLPFCHANSNRKKKVECEQRASSLSPSIRQG